MKDFHTSQHAETRLDFSAGCTGGATLSQANIYRLGPLVRVVSDLKESLYCRKPTFVGLNLFVRVALRRVAQSVSKCHELRETVNLVPRSLVDKAEGEVWPNPICIT